MRAKVSFDGYIIFFSRPKPKRHLRFVWLNDGFEFSTGVTIPEVEHFHGGKAAGHVARYVVRDCVAFVLSTFNIDLLLYRDHLVF